MIRALKTRFPGIESPPKEDICYATTNRQDAVKQLAQASDVVIVLGSQNSSNSRRLQEIGASFGKPSFLIDGAEELRQDWFTNCGTVLITAGRERAGSGGARLHSMAEQRIRGDSRRDHDARRTCFLPATT